MNRSTIIIPNYNGIKFLDGCLKSLQTEPVDVIVVDNGSKDGSERIVPEHYPSIRQIVLDKNYGFCTAVNRGIMECKTEYVILLNNDTEVEPGFVRHLEETMDRNQKIFSGSAQMINAHRPDVIDDTGDYYCALGWAFTLGKDRSVQKYQKGRRIFAACGGAAIYRRNLLNNTGYFDETHFAYLEDIDLGYRARILGYTNLYIPEAKVYHYGSGTSGSRHNEFKVRLASRNSIYLIHKNMPIFQKILNLPFFLIGFSVKTVFFIKKGFGKVYVKGLLEGFSMSLSKEGRKSKVSFEWKNFGNYCVIQWELWRNMIYRLL